MTELFSEPFMRRALLAAMILAPLCGLLGVFVTARRFAFFSDTISHGALAGVALGYLWGFTDPSLPMLGFIFVVAWLLMWLRENTDLSSDTLMALLLSGSVSIGIIVLSLLKGYRGEIQRYLFGDVLAIGLGDLLRAGSLSLCIGALVFWQLSALTLFTANEDMAHVCGIPVRRFQYLFVFILAATVAAGIRLLGIMLITSLLVIPAATARNLSRSLRQQIILAMIVGLIGGLAGTALSFKLNVPCGPAIVLTCIGLFLVSMLLARFVRRAPTAG